MTIQYTDRAYQVALSEFMIAMQPYALTINGVKQNKIKLFNRIWENHRYMTPDKPFIVHKDTTCQLILAGNHPQVHIERRDVVPFNEDELTRQAVKTLMIKRAVPALRECGDPDKMLSTVCDAMAKVYFEHEAIEKEVERMIIT